MALNLPTFFTRTASAIVFAVIMLAGLLWHEIAFVLLIAVIQALCLYEYPKLIQKTEPGMYWPQGLSLFVQLICFLLLASVYLLYYSANPTISAMPLLSVLWVTPALGLMYSQFSDKVFIKAWSFSVSGILYISIPCLSLLLLRKYDVLLPLYVILLIWTNDTMAYLVGSFIGKTPFSPISPKKTWEGTVGGAILTVAGGAIYGYYSHTYRLVDWVAIAAIVAVMGTLGDLMESKLKRLANVKDSGKIMPGHGGALDRFDSLLIAAPFVFLYVSLLMPAVK